MSVGDLIQFIAAGIMAGGAIALIIVATWKDGN